MPGSCGANIGPFRAGRISACERAHWSRQTGIFYDALPAGRRVEDRRRRHDVVSDLDAVKTVSSVGAIAVAPATQHQSTSARGDLVGEGAIDGVTA